MICVKNVFVWFLWLFLHSLVLGVAAIPLFLDMNTYIWQILGIAFYFVLFFLSPMFYRYNAFSTVIFCLQLIVVTMTFYPYSAGEFPLYFLVCLIYGLIVAEAAERLTSKQFTIVGVGSVVALLIVFTRNVFTTADLLIVGIFVLVLGAGLVYYHLIRQRAWEFEQSYQTLLQEYRQLTRRVTVEEELVRKQERQMIGQEIHDSVGHKLTSTCFRIGYKRLGAGFQTHSCYPLSPNGFNMKTFPR